MKEIASLFRIWVLMGILALVSHLHAQVRPVAVFRQNHISFDTLREEAGPVMRRFEVTNEGDAVLRLLDVKAGCGCTTTDWEKKPIPPGQAGYIDVEYNPAGRPGGFSNAVAVTTNDPDRITIILQISGMVLPRPKTTEELYPHVQGSLRFRSNHITLGEAFLGQTKQDTFFFVNTADKPVIWPEKQKSLPAWLQAVPHAAKTLPGEEGHLVIRYEASLRQAWGLLFDTARINVLDVAGPVKILTMGVKVLDTLDRLPQVEIAQAASLHIVRDSYNFTSIPKGDTVHYRFELRNQGKKPLEIRKMSAACPCIEFMESVTDIPPGGQAFIEVRMLTSGLSGPQHKTIYLVTNDPRRQEVYLHLIGTVK